MSVTIAITTSHTGNRPRYYLRDYRLRGLGGDQALSFCFVVLGTKLRASHMLGREQLSSELQPLALSLDTFFILTVQWRKLRQRSNSLAQGYRTTARQRPRPQHLAESAGSTPERFATQPAVDCQTNQADFFEGLL